MAFLQILSANRACRDLLVVGRRGQGLCHQRVYDEVAGGDGRDLAFVLGRLGVPLAALDAQGTALGRQVGRQVEQVGQNYCLTPKALLPIRLI